MAEKEQVDVDPEIAAIDVVHKALKGLGPDAQSRVIAYVAQKLKIELRSHQREKLPEGESYEEHEILSPPPVEQEHPATDELEGISPVARKWMARNGITTVALSKLFSLGIDEIDLIAPDVSGKKIKDRMHKVLLLKGIAAFLGTGTARFGYEEFRQACEHYNALDTNFAKHLKSFSPKVSSDKSGFALTARGLAAGTQLVKEMSADATK